MTWASILTIAIIIIIIIIIVILFKRINVFKEFYNDFFEEHSITDKETGEITKYKRERNFKNKCLAILSAIGQCFLLFIFLPLLLSVIFQICTYNPYSGEDFDDEEVEYYDGRKLSRD